MVKVAVRMPALTGDAGEYLADVRALDAAGAAMVTLEARGEDLWTLLGAIAVTTERIGLWLDEAPPPALERLAGGRVVVGEPAPGPWVQLALPPTRDAWAEAIRDHQAAGTEGVVVQWDPRLLDLLRNPDPDDRSDLLMSTG